jgi:hypothetical protein
MHPNEIKLDKTNLLELWQKAQQLGKHHVAALKEQAIRQDVTLPA